MEGETKRCTKCGEEKGWGEFGNERRNRNGKKSWCRACNTENSLARGAAYVAAGRCRSHPERDVIPGRDRCVECMWEGTARYLRRAGSPEIDTDTLRAWWERTIIGQCGRDPITGGELTAPCVDHCHACGELRGVLNNETNKELGHLRDSPAMLVALADLYRLGENLPGKVFAINSADRAEAAFHYLVEHFAVCPAAKAVNEPPPQQSEGPCIPPGSQ